MGYGGNGITFSMMAAQMLRGTDHRRGRPGHRLGIIAALNPPRRSHPRAESAVLSCPGGVGAAPRLPTRPARADRGEFLEFLDARDAVAYLNPATSRNGKAPKIDDWTERLLTRHQALTREPQDAEARRAAARRRRRARRHPRDARRLRRPEPRGRERAGRARLRGPPRQVARLRRTLRRARACLPRDRQQAQFEGGTIDRGGALGLWYDLEDPARRKALHDAFLPLWAALNGNNEPDSPYRRLIKLAAAEESTSGSGVAAAARAIGVSVDDVEKWLVQILEAWRDANPSGTHRALGLPLLGGRGQPPPRAGLPGRRHHQCQRPLLPRPRRRPRRARRRVRHQGPPRTSRRSRTATS